MPDIKKPVAKVADAASKLFLARLEAIDAILAGADPHEVLMVCVHALASAAPGCCEEHLAEFEAELLEHLRECVALQRQAEDAADDDAAPSSVH
jgi:hypothetical protein